MQVQQQQQQHQPIVPSTYATTGILTPAPSPVWPSDYPVNTLYECPPTSTMTIPPLHRLDSTASMAVSVGSFGNGAPIMDLDDSDVSPPPATSMFGELPRSSQNVWDSPPPDMEVDVGTMVTESILGSALAPEAATGYHVAGSELGSVNVNVDASIPTGLASGENWHVDTLLQDIHTTLAPCLPSTQFSPSAEQQMAHLANSNNLPLSHSTFPVTKPQMMFTPTPYTPSWHPGPIQHAPVAAEPGYPPQPLASGSSSAAYTNKPYFPPTATMTRPRSLSYPSPHTQAYIPQAPIHRHNSISVPAMIKTETPITFINSINNTYATSPSASSSSSADSGSSGSTSSTSSMSSNASHIRNNSITSISSSITSTAPSYHHTKPSSKTAPPPTTTSPKQPQPAKPHPYHCPCGRTYQTLGGLRAHTKLHNQPRSFHCPSCPKSFLRKQDLKRHEVTHAERRPFGCGCGVRFTRSDALQRHVRARRCEWGR
ncbi:hypothetical protein HDV00_011372 [Rhizophlyctis rosea]|nr:hypothetical protein HDV00_011372 [Rhizophlyctis rosea]